MLRKFTVENFKPFKERFTLDLSKPGSYEFSPECIRDGVVSKGAIYGINAVGKSNFGLAIFDIVNTLTNKVTELDRYRFFLNLNSKKKYAFFDYEFQFDGHIVEYSYKKKNVNELLEESLKIDDEEMLYYDFENKTGSSKFKGSETTNLVDDSKNSRVKFIMNTTVLDESDVQNSVLRKFKNFVEHMLLFYSLKDNGFIGFRDSAGLIESIIINAGKVKDFETFLRNQNIDVRLDTKEFADGKKLCIIYDNGYAYFFDRCVVSTGMVSLALYYSWLIYLEECSFVIIDEFDAFYHYELAEEIINELKQRTNTQIFVTTHNTDLLSNDLLRPDCYFLLDSVGIRPLNHCTEKDLRLAHNLQKMFKAGAFERKKGNA